MKKLKVDLKIWNREVFGFVNLARDKMLKKLQELDERDDESDLDEHGREESGCCWQIIVSFSLSKKPF